LVTILKRVHENELYSLISSATHFLPELHRVLCVAPIDRQGFKALQTFQSSSFKTPIAASCHLATHNPGLTLMLS
jgi:hypothetical protein